MNLEEYEVGTEHINFKRIFLISDLHFGVRSNNIEWIENQANFFRNFYIPYLKERVQPGDILFVLGDWYDNRQLLDILVMNTSVDIMIELAEILPVHIITGNHDIYKKQDTDVNSLRSFKYIPNVTIYEKPVVITNGTSKILLLPWVGDKDKEELYAKSNPTEYLFAHTDINGFKYDNGRRIMRGARLCDMEHYKMIFSGHIHKRQHFQNAIYIGSPYSTKRSDIGNKKAVYLFTPDSGDVDVVMNNYSPVFQRIHLEEILNWTLEKTQRYLENNYTDIIVPDKYIHLFNLTRFVELFDNCNYKRLETRGETMKLDDNIENIIEGEEIKDILTLLEGSINDLEYPQAMKHTLLEMNKKYYFDAHDDENID